jgi:hypothetical protein
MNHIFCIYNMSPLRHYCQNMSLLVKKNIQHEMQQIICYKNIQHELQHTHTHKVILNGRHDISVFAVMS